MALEFREYREADLEQMIRIWNVVVEAGDAFPQIEPLNEQSAREFFAAQSYTGVAAIDETVFGLYILHPNNIGRCAHVANASYAVAKASRGLGLGKALVEDSLRQAVRLGFRGMQFNAVVADNEAAIHVCESLDFKRIGTIPGGFVSGVGNFEDMHIYYRDCMELTSPDLLAEEMACAEVVDGARADEALEQEQPKKAKKAKKDKDAKDKKKSKKKKKNA